MNTYIRNNPDNPDLQPTWNESCNNHHDGLSDHAIEIWLNTQNLQTKAVGRFPTNEECNLISMLNSLSEFHNCETFLCRNNSHAFTIKRNDLDAL